MHQRSSNRGALHFSATELMHRVFRPLAHTNQLEHLHCATPGFLLANVLNRKRKTNVPDPSKCRKNIEKLKYDTEPVTAISRQLLFGGGNQGPTFDQDFATVRFVQAAHEMQKRALAGT